VSGVGAPEERVLDGAGLRVAVIATRWHSEVTDVLADGAVAAAKECGIPVRDVTVVRVPGAFELPVMAAAMARRPDIDAVVCLGVVVRGGTPHFDYVCDAVTAGCTRVALDSGKPVGFGVLTCDTMQQALERAGGAEGNKGRDALLAAVETALALRRV
jgi:6,7-dimethyl-8-ribityllumazine synthase